jgi:hypothetical protein
LACGCSLFFVVDCCLVSICCGWLLLCRSIFSWCRRRQFASGGCRSRCFSLLCCCLRSYMVRGYIYLFFFAYLAVSHLFYIFFFFVVTHHGESRAVLSSMAQFPFPFGRSTCLLLLLANLYK